MQREYWQGVTEKAKSFVRKCLTVDPTNRPTATELLKDPWLDGVQQQYAASANNETAGAPDLLPHVKKAFDARKTCEYDFIQDCSSAHWGNHAS